MFAARHYRLNLRESLIVNYLLKFPMSILPGHDNNGGDSGSVLKCRDRVRDNWFPGNLGKEFIESHPPAAARGDDNRCQHEKKLRG